MNIIIQAGGRGSRLRHLTWNKPKCLVSVHGEPMLFKVFKAFPDSKFYVIGDYGYEILDAYLKLNGTGFDITLLKASGHGTASGIKQALDAMPLNEPFLLMWSDLVFNQVQDLNSLNKPTVFLTNEFVCRWSVNHGRMEEVTSSDSGIPGLFYFPEKSYLSTISESGEFVRWLSGLGIKFEFQYWQGLSEVGEFHHIEKQNDEFAFARFFNDVQISEDKVTKSSKIPEYAKLIPREISWYHQVSKLGFERIPKLFSENPFTMERIHGKHAFEMNDLSEREKKCLIVDMIDNLKSLHKLGSIKYREQEYISVYKDKTISRVQEISPLIEDFDKKSFVINGKKCRNFFYGDCEKNFDEIIAELGFRDYTVIHGDPTFSNTLVDEYLRAWLIDPRGYFAEDGMYGDPLYDFSKLYYSAVGGYDLVNRKKFKVYIDAETVEVLYETPSFSLSAEEVFRKEFTASELRKIKILHALIWYALSGYAKDDIDTVLAAFYLGTYWMNDAVG